MFIYLHMSCFYSRYIFAYTVTGLGRINEYYLLAKIEFNIDRGMSDVNVKLYENCVSS